jgi:hypothetical protein
MMNFKKRLCIDIEETQADDCEEIQANQIKRESFNINLGSNFLSVLLKSDEEKNKILESENGYLHQILNYMESEHKAMDLSYNWYVCLLTA